MSAENNLNEPENFAEAMNSSKSKLWKQSMQSEMNSMQQNKVRDLVESPEGKNVLKTKWVFKKKLGPNGEVVKYKARLVAKGFSQKYSIDYYETFSPVTRFDSIRAILSLSVQNDMFVHQMDVSTAFLNGELKDEVYMAQPEGFVEKGKENFVCKLNKSIYGLKQAPRCWNVALDSYLKEIGVKQSESDPCIYLRNNGELFVIAVYVNMTTQFQCPVTWLLCCIMHILVLHVNWSL